jgi:hypothetical protein
MNDESESNVKRVISLKVLGLCVVIIGVTVGIIGSSIKQDRNHPEANACLVNLGHYGKALALYRADYDEYSPIFEGTHSDLVSKLTKYGAGRLLSCPKISGSSAGRNYQARTVRPTTARYKAFYGIVDESIAVQCDMHFNTRWTVVWNGLKPRLGHTIDSNNPGLTNVLFRNGSVKSIPSNSPKFGFLYDHGIFTRENPLSRPKLATGQLAFTYAFEPVPPALERQLLGVRAMRPKYPWIFELLYTEIDFQYFKGTAEETSKRMSLGSIFSPALRIGLEELEATLWFAELLSFI